LLTHFTQKEDDFKVAKAFRERTLSSRSEKKHKNSITEGSQKIASAAYSDIFSC